MITSAEERALYTEWVKLWESYKKSSDEVMALSRKAAGQVPREAHELNTKTANKIALEADTVSGRTSTSTTLAPTRRRRMQPIATLPL